MSAPWPFLFQNWPCSELANPHTKLVSSELHSLIYSLSAVMCVGRARSCLSEWLNFHLFLLMQATARRQEKSHGWVWTLPQSGTNIHEALSFQKVPPLPSMKLEMDELFYAGEKSLFSQRRRRTFSPEPSFHPTCTGSLKRNPQFLSSIASAYKRLPT